MVLRFRRRVEDFVSSLFIFFDDLSSTLQYIHADEDLRGQESLPFEREAKETLEH
jgi:hypothetical protein